MMDYVANCEVCQQQKYQTTTPASLLQPLALLTVVWENVSLDFIFRLSKSQGFDTVLMIIDKFSKYGLHLAKTPLYSQKVGKNLCQGNRQLPWDGE